VILEAKQIHRKYETSLNALQVLKGIDFAVEEGEVVSIVGPSGAGKSTLLHILGGLDQPNEGTVMLDGEDLYRLKDGHRARVRNSKIGFIFQFYHLLPEFTALENVILPLLINKDQGQNKQFEAQGATLLEQVGLKERLTHRPHQLSGGEQQRVAIARALINEPKIIFCDEPTGNLDSQSGKEIIHLLMEVNQKNHQTLVIVTHDENIAHVSKRMIAMRDGRFVDE